MQEEDFATQLYNRELLHVFPPEDILAHLQKARKDLADFAETSIRMEHKQAIMERLDLRTTLMKVWMACLDDLQSSDITQCLTRLDAVDRSSMHAEPIPEAFSIKIQHRLASSVPPRPMIAVGRLEWTTFFRQMLTNVGSAFEMFKISHNCDLFTAYWIFMSQQPQPSVYVRALLQSFLTVNEQVLGRIWTKDFLIEDLKALVLPASVLLDPANEAIENPVDIRFRVASQIAQFIHRAATPFMNQYRSFCQNRCRLRRLLCHAALELDNIQADAEEIDGCLQTLTSEQPMPYPAGEAPTYAYPLSSWLYHYKLIQLQVVVHMGFELSVYATHEFAGMYWYLSHLTSIHLSHIERISYFVSSQAPSQAGQSRDAQSKEMQDALALLYRHFSRLKATDTLASALHRLYVVLQRNGYCAKASPAYSRDELRFDLRMRAFQSLSIPEPLTFDEMMGLADLRTLSDRQLLDQTARLALTSRRAWEEILKQDWNFKPLNSHMRGELQQESVIEREWKRDIRNSMKACIGTSIAATALIKAFDVNDSGKKEEGSSGLASLKITIPGPEDSNRFHRWWAVPTIS